MDLSASNQWAASSFHRHLADSFRVVELDLKKIGISGRRRDYLLREYVEAYMIAWLDAAMPAGMA